MEVDILLSIYNGSAFLREQLDSLSKQKTVSINLIVRDDCSTDDSLSILSSFSEKFHQITVINSENKNLGSSRSFYELLKFSSADYIFFCDQDDFWNDSKCIKQIEVLKKSKSNTVAGVFSDMKLVDLNLDDLGTTLLKSQRMKPANILKYREGIFAQNPVAGCALCINKAAKNKILELQPIVKSVVHDHWFSCIIRLYGSLYYLNEPLVDYRQHDSNQIGNKEVNFSYMVTKSKSISNTFEHDKVLLGLVDKNIKFSYLRFLYLKLSLNLNRLVSF
jgi:glycosyltransferase involved in cell wall biosynthesis